MMTEEQMLRGLSKQNSNLLSPLNNPTAIFWSDFSSSPKQ